MAGRGARAASASSSLEPATAPRPITVGPRWKSAHTCASPFRRSLPADNDVPRHAPWKFPFSPLLEQTTRPDVGSQRP